MTRSRQPLSAPRSATAAEGAPRRLPKPGAPVRGSRTGRPIMVALDLLGRRSALRLLWELRGGPLTFRALQEACASNARLLNTRLAELRASGLVEHAVGGYRLSAEGRRLLAALQPLSEWAQGWARHHPAALEGADGGAPPARAAPSKAID